MILCDSVRKSGIRSHYDLATPFYRLLWGPHIHHGLWEDATPSAGDASPRDAQLHLTNTLADSPAKRPQVEKVYEAFLCPSLGSFSDYRGWMKDAA